MATLTGTTYVNDKRASTFEIDVESADSDPRIAVAINNILGDYGDMVSVSQKAKSLKIMIGRYG